MDRIDCEIYVKQIISFFENNSDDFMLLVGNVQKEKFYEKIRKKSFENFENGLDYVLSKQQIIDIVIELKLPELVDKLNPQEIIDGYIQKTKWGKINLN